MYCAVEIALYESPAKRAAYPFQSCSADASARHPSLWQCRHVHVAGGYAAEAAAIAGLGFRAYKMRPGAGPEHDLETVRLMRKAVGPDFDLMVDAHTWWRMGDRSYSLETVERLAREMAEYNIAWLEEPLPPDDHAGYLDSKTRTSSRWRPASMSPARSATWI